MIGCGRVIFRLFQVFPSFTLNTTGTRAPRNDPRINLGLSTQKTAVVKTHNPEFVSIHVLTSVITMVFEEKTALLGRKFRWEDLGVNLYDMEEKAYDGIG